MAMIGHFWKVMLFSLLVVGVAGAALLYSFGGRVNAAGSLNWGDPSTGSALSGVPGDRSVSLSWGAFPGAPGYSVEETDLATGKTQALPIVNGTTVSVNSLAVGRWYRFSVTPLGDPGVVMPTQAIEARTRGFQAYDHYFALGDSYSAGDGAPPYMGAQGCYRSSNSYPFLLELGTPDLIACTSAVTANIDMTRQSAFVPGTQISQLRAGAPANSLVTITIGGNDVQFANELKNCVLSFHSCTGRHDIIANNITALKPRLVQVYREIRQAAPGADIVAVGYPLLVAAPDKAHCHNPVVYFGLSGAEMLMLRQLAGMLDDVIAQAASEAGVVAATTEVEQTFAGHEACTANEGDEWINEVAGLNDLLHDSFHPNAHGYAADAQAVKMRLAGLYGSGMVR